MTSADLFKQPALITRRCHPVHNADFKSRVFSSKKAPERFVMDKKKSGTAVRWWALTERGLDSAGECVEFLAAHISLMHQTKLKKTRRVQKPHGKVDMWQNTDEKSLIISCEFTNDGSIYEWNIKGNWNLLQYIIELHLICYIYIFFFNCCLLTEMSHLKQICIKIVSRLCCHIVGKFLVWITTALAALPNWFVVN